MSRKYETQHFANDEIAIIPPHLESPDLQHWQQILREWLSSKPIYEKSFQDWKKNVERIEQSNPIYVVGHHEGLGDTVHQVRYALVFACRFPDKKIVYTTKSPEIFDKTGLPTNLQIIDPNSAVHEIHRDRNIRAIVFNPSVYTNFERFENDDDYECENIPTINRNFSQVFFEFWSKWGHVFSDYGEKPAHQILIQWSKIKMLLGMDLYPGFPVVPMVLPGKNKKYPEVMIVYDAKERDRIKLLDPENQWAKAINYIIDRCPNIRVGIVQGKTHPEDAERILDKVGKKGSVEMLTFNGPNSLIDLIQAGLSAKVVTTVDTGPGHLINEAKRRAKTFNKPTPKIVSVMGVNYLFGPMYYRLDLATTILATHDYHTIEKVPPELIGKQVVDEFKSY